MKRPCFHNLCKILVLAALLMAPGARAADSQPYHRIEDVIYGRKFGTALTMDVFKPEHPNGFGIVFIVSGGWFSAKEAVSPVLCQFYIDRGYTVFAVVHGSQPKFQIPEIIHDINRAVRFIRHNAGRYGIDPNRIGITGMSAGGHLSLIMGTQGGAGDSKAKDPVDRESSAIQCVACFFPPTDFVNYGGPHTNVLGEHALAKFKPAFGNVSTNPAAREEYLESISPIYSVTTNMPPTLIIQGDADKLVPEQQALAFRDKAESCGDTIKLIIKPGEGHGWKNYTGDMESCADWFDRYLRKSAGAN
jgi:acetyl esterase/lipase